MYESVAMLEKYTSWFFGLISIGVTFRCTVDLIMGYFDGDFNNAFIRCKKILLAGVIGICASGFIIFSKRFYI